MEISETIAAWMEDIQFFARKYAQAHRFPLPHFITILFFLTFWTRIERNETAQFLPYASEMIFLFSVPIIL